MKVALCVIVKNAEHTIQKLLDSTKNAFDEYVFVDTGSTDNTREVIAKFFGLTGLWGTDSAPAEGKGEVDITSGNVTLASFGWCKDFGAARNYSFSLATAPWRMYLDADDELVHDSGKLVNMGATIDHVLKIDDKINALCFRYEYVKGVKQDVVRCVLWTEGFCWEDPIHEMLTLPTAPRRQAVLNDIRVVHHKSESDHAAAFVRNREIMDAYLLANPDLPAVKKGRIRYHLALDELHNGDPEKAAQIYQDILTDVRGTNYALLAAGRLVYLLVEYGNNFTRAREVAGEVVRDYPGERTGYALLGWVYALEKQWYQAAEVFDRLRSITKPEVSQDEEEWFTKGAVPASQALAYAHSGRWHECENALAQVSALGRRTLFAQQAFSEAQTLLMRHIGFEALKRYVDYLIWDTEAPRALELLQNHVPSALSTQAFVHQMRHDIEKMLPQLNGWEAYKAAYASIPESTYHTDSHSRDDVLRTIRVTKLLEWARGLDDLGPVVHVCAVGFQDGIIEGALLEASQRIVLTVADVAPQASKGLKELQEKYPGRVLSHAITRGEYDWGQDTFDVVTLFEVIEHVPSDVVALAKLKRMLKKDGRLFVSTPIADRWVEPYLTDDKLKPAWYGHVRAHNHVSLTALIEAGALTGRVWEGWDNTFLMELFHSTGALPQKRIGIIVPGTPKPFDAESPQRGFLGGSEEAVVFLSQALAKCGYKVEVFAPTYVREDYSRLRYNYGVLYRDISEYSPYDNTFDSLLFWRCPQMAREPWFKDVGVNGTRTVLWLHDAFYGATSADYAAFDSVLSLSKHHARCLKERDGAGMSTIVANGIDSRSLPAWSGDRENRVIYASSPDRGLEPLLDIWPDVVKAVPDAKLDIYYDWTAFRAHFPKDAARLDEKIEKAPNVLFHGGVSQPALHEAMTQAKAWVYLNSGDVETFCITRLKMIALGVYPITTKAGALTEIVPEAGFYVESPDEALNVLIDVLKKPTDVAARQKYAEWAVERYDWMTVTKQMFLPVLENASPSKDLSNAAE